MNMLPSLGTLVARAAFYADPGSGALLWQLIASFFIGLMFYIRRIAAWFHPHEKRQDDAAGPQK